MDPLVIEDSSAGVRYITINRPDRMNALNSEVLGMIELAVAEASSEVNVGCIVIRGEGDRAFCAGADLGEIQGLSSEAAHAFIRRGQQTMSTIEASRIPVIAAVDGWALGGGFELMLACHLVVASDRSRFGLPESKIGCIPGFGGTQRLMTAVGRAPGFHLLLTGDPIDADRATAIGLLSIPPVSSTDFDAVVAKLAESLAGGSRTGVRSILEAGMRAAHPAALEHEAALAALAIASADGQEGIEAFAERRAPNFARGAQS